MGVRISGLGMFGFAVGHPIDTVKVMQQLRNSGPAQATKYVYSVGGIRGFYRGFSFPFFTNGILHAAFFGVYGTVLDCFTLRRMELQERGLTTAVGEPVYRHAYFKAKGMATGLRTPLARAENVEATFLEMFTAGSVAGFSQIIVAAPIDLIKVQLQSSIHKQTTTGAFDVCKMIYRASGIRGFYHGAPAMAIRNVNGAALNFAILFYLLEGVSDPENFKNRNLDFWLEVLPAAGVAGMMSWWFVMPFDVIKSKMQADCHPKPKYKNMWDCGTNIYRQSGARGLFQGFWFASLRAFPVSASTFIAYSLILRECHRLAQ